MKITATTLIKFTEIDEAINKLDEDFIKNFEQAEYLLEGYGNNIKLTSTHYYNEEIKLPKGFIIERIDNEEYPEYEKDKDGNIKERIKYKIQIDGNINGQRLCLVYSNLFKINIQIIVQ